jgi:hypothetical protein
MAEHPVIRMTREMWNRIGRALPETAAILLALAVLAGLDGIVLKSISPFRALGWGLLSLGCALFSLCRGDQRGERLVAEVAISISVVAVCSALVDVFAFSSCGFDCLTR